MLSFHNDHGIKVKYLARIDAHQAADNITQGIGWENGKGCAIGCTLEAYDHSRYPIELGIPEWLARLEDSIFEGLPNSIAKEWPARFLNAVPVGVDLDVVRHKIAALRMDRLIAIQEANKARGECGYGVDELIAKSIAALRIVRKYHADAINGDESAALSARSDACLAMESAMGSATMESAWSAESAARSAARSVELAELAAAWSAESAADSAWSAPRSVGLTRSAARSAALEQEADALISVLGDLGK